MDIIFSIYFFLTIGLLVGLIVLKEWVSNLRVVTRPPAESIIYDGKTYIFDYEADDNHDYYYRLGKREKEVILVKQTLSRSGKKEYTSNGVNITPCTL